MSCLASSGWCPFHTASLYRPPLTSHPGLMLPPSACFGRIQAPRVLTDLLGHKPPQGNTGALFPQSIPVWLDTDRCVLFYSLNPTALQTKPVLSRLLFASQSPGSLQIHKKLV